MSKPPDPIAAIRRSTKLLLVWLGVCVAPAALLLLMNKGLWPSATERSYQTVIKSAHRTPVPISRVADLGIQDVNVLSTLSNAGDLRVYYGATWKARSIDLPVVGTVVYALEVRGHAFAAVDLDGRYDEYHDIQMSTGEDMKLAMRAFGSPWSVPIGDSTVVLQPGLNILWRTVGPFVAICVCASAGVAAGLRAMTMSLTARGRKRRGACIPCGYPLSDGADVCPECGAASAQRPKALN